MRYIKTFFLILTFLNINNAHSEALNDAQIKQIENIAQSIASTSNANAKATQESNSFHATAIGRNVIFENISQTKKGLSKQKMKEIEDAIRKEVIPKICLNNANNPAFDRGLNYTLIYKNTYNEKIAEFNIDKPLCSKFN
jgi:hypothetical protein